MHASTLLLPLVALTAISPTASVVSAQATNTATLSPSSPFDKSNNCTLLPNKDRIGFEYKNMLGRIEECPLYAKIFRAATWTWSDKLGGMCWFKSRVGPLVDKAGSYATDCVDPSVSYACNAFQDVDFVGGDLDNKPAAAFADCCDLCNQNERCNMYTWSNYNGGTCWLKGYTPKVVASPGVIAAGLITFNGLCPLEYDVDFVGNDVGSKPAKEAGLCCDLCKSDSRCKAYTWTNYNGGTCWLKSGKGQTVKTVGVVSAFIRN